MQPKIKPALSKLDLELLAILQLDGRIAMSDLADRLGLDHNATQRRVSQLEAAGYIAGYQAIINAENVLDCYQAILLISVGHRSANNHARLAHFVSQENAIVECFFMGGANEYVLKVRTSDLDAFRQLTVKLYQYIPDIQSIDHRPVLDTLKSGSAGALGPGVL